MIGLLHSKLGIALGWTLLHSLWEGAIAALVLAIALSVLRSPRARYAMACAALFGMMAAFGLTMARVMSEAGVPTAVDVRVSHTGSGQGALSFPLAARVHAADILPWLTLFWIAGVVVFHLHLLVGWLAARRMRRRGVCVAAEAWQERLAQLRRRLRVSGPVLLLESALAKVPVVMGYWRPAILIPAGLLAGMPALQMEAILLHELAHVLRRDYLVNWLQALVEGFLFYHPAAWWISSVIRAERENCCDDVVVEASGDSREWVLEYAAALTALEESRWAAYDAVAANGGNLMKRIRRLLYPQERPRIALWPVLAALVLLVAGALAMQVKPKPTPYQMWLQEDVAYIITDQERAAFNALTSDEEREHFIEQFWERRPPGFKEEHYRRIAYANEHFYGATEGWRSDRGMTYIKYGPPDEIESHPKGDQDRAYPFEQWLYHHIDGRGDNVVMDFEDRTWSGEYRLVLTQQNSQ